MSMKINSRSAEPPRSLYTMTMHLIVSPLRIIEYLFSKSNPVPLLSLFLLLTGCWSTLPAQNVNITGNTIQSRFLTPRGYTRVQCESRSFCAYLRNYPLKNHGADVLLYDGSVKPDKVHAAVFRMELLKRDLVQCADAIMKLRAEYLYENKRYSEISYTITNGMLVPYSKYARGGRVRVKGGKTEWISGRTGGYGRAVFDAYLEFIYIYAGTLSLSREMRPVDIADIRIGDVFIFGGTPGHAVLVCDLAVDTASGRKIMLLGQSYMPSQEFHIIKSFEDISPWYYVRDEELLTPEWTFKRGSLKRFD